MTFTLSHSQGRPSSSPHGSIPPRSRPISKTDGVVHRIGIIGLGTVGARFVDQFNLHDDFDLVAAWDPDRDACAAHRDSVAIVDDAASVIALADAVYIAVPPLFHREYVEACVAAGVGVFCEKPLGIDVTQSRALVELVAASGVPAGVNFVFSAAPSAVELAERTKQGAIGDIIRGDLRLHFAEWPRAWHAKAQWLKLRDQGGWIREVVSHFLFVANRVLGPLTLDHAIVTFPDGADGQLSEIDALARLSAPSGTPLVLIGTGEGIGPDVVDLTIRGTTGSLRLVDWYHLQSSDGGDWQHLLGTDRAELGANAYGRQLGELSKMLSGEPHSIATFAEALAVQELVEQMLA
jgi:predicted dehydrogenase